MRGNRQGVVHGGLHYNMHVFKPKSLKSNDALLRLIGTLVA